jgi:phosphodiesterase/alkaline phosphatase D-like protein
MVDRFSRREWLRLIGAARAGSMLPLRGRPLAPAAFQNYPFSLGVASGEPLPERLSSRRGWRRGHSTGAACRW